MHTNINKYILAHPFLSTYSKLSSQFRFVDRRNHKKKQKNFLAVFPFKNKRRSPRVEANFRRIPSCLFTFSNFGGHTESIDTIFSPLNKPTLATKFASRSSGWARDAAGARLDYWILKEKNDKHPIEATIYLHLNCQTSYAETDVYIYFLLHQFDFCY